MNASEKKAYKIWLYTVMFLTVGAVVNFVAAKYWIGVKWGLGAGAFAALLPLLIASQKKKHAQNKADGAIFNMGAAAIVVLSVLAFGFFGFADGAFAIGCLALLMCVFAVANNNASWSIGKGFAYGLPMLFAAQLFSEQAAALTLF